MSSLPAWIRSRPSRLLPLAGIALALVLALAGCGLGAGESSTAGTELTVSRNFGAEEVGRDARKTIPGGETVMRQLQREFDVTTRYGGGFVQEIDGVSGGRRSGRPVDWFYYVNGIEAGEGAASRRLEPGDRVWWDHHDWGAAMRIPAVVGSFPEPFLSGPQGKKTPVRIDCAGDGQRECREVRERLEEAGVQVGGSGPLGVQPGPGPAAAAGGTVVGGARRSGGAPARAGAEGLGRVRAPRRVREVARAARPAGPAGADLARGRGSGRRDAVPRSAADVGGDGHRPGRRGRPRRRRWWRSA